MLDEAGESHAIVSGVRGGLRYRNARIHGVWAHSGGAPRDSRADAVFAFADLVQALDADWAEVLDGGEDLAVTFGRVDAAGPLHAMAKVPGQLEFCLDLRSEDNAVLDRMDAMLKSRIAAIEAARPGIRFELGAQSRSQPMQLSPRLGDWLEAGAASLGAQSPAMANQLAGRTPTGTARPQQGRRASGPFRWPGPILPAR
ncbi:hypothetical protein [Mangrovicoccus ximenensis]|uniref:hypothetical protein n=1 Tax=Mangrovicoccus ximenensis TaxID=1911570 RepID=UPI000D3BD216|nr:hypothetical protein [Mangrovicoccus ximenensis]